MLVTLEPAAGRELRKNAGDQQGYADGEGADDPVQLDATFEHEPVEESQHKNQNGRLGKERGATMGCDRDQIEERGWALLCNDSYAGRNKRKANR